MRTKILSIVGTRPNLIKEALVGRGLRLAGVQEVLVHTGQHYDHEMSAVFFEGLSLPTPDHYLDQGGRGTIEQTAGIMRAMEGVLRSEHPSATLVYGDVDSTLGAALASAKTGIPVIHVEGGVRCKRLYNPEEINRRLTDQLSALVFASTRTDIENLRREGFTESRISLSGDVHLDIVRRTLSALAIVPKRTDYVVVTIHRAENADSEPRLRAIVDGLLACGSPWAFPTHPRVARQLRLFGLWDRLTASSNGRVLKPLGYVDFLRLLADADRVLTDSGGVRREAYMLEKPVIVPIDMIWFPEIVEAGWARVVEPTCEDVTDGLRTFEPSGPHVPIFGDGRAHERIVDAIVGFCGEDRSR